MAQRATIHRAPIQRAPIQYAGWRSRQGASGAVMQSGYDVVVVGARCAGASTAMLLARAGLRVLLVDRTAVGSDIINGNVVKAGGAERLRAWGILDALWRAGTPALTRRRISCASFDVEVSNPEGAAAWCAPRRFLLDRLLVEAAAEAGAEVRDGTAVRGLVWDDGRVTGVRLAGRDGRDQPVPAGLVVGADGRNSLVARSAGAKAYATHPTASAWYWAFWSGLPASDALTMHFRERRLCGVFPTNDGLTILAIEAPWEERRAFQENPESAYLADLATFAAVADVTDGGSREGRVLGMVELPNFFRVPFGPGWALVGDAGHHKDPAGARGISDALRDAELCALAVLRGFARGSLATELAVYQAARDRATMEVHEINVELARLDRPAVEMPLLVRRLGEAEDAADAAFPPLATAGGVLPSGLIEAT